MQLYPLTTYQQLNIFLPIPHQVTTKTNLYYLLAVAVSAVWSTGCAPQAKDSTESVAAIDQVNLCEVKDWRRNVVAESCKPGQKVVYLPGSWGNEQLPIFFVAVNCDLRYSVSLTNGGAVCIYRPITPKES